MRTLCLCFKDDDDNQFSDVIAVTADGLDPKLQARIFRKARPIG